ncbi:MAG TPA: hypothetical protein VNI20_06275, partial [Fimbriimonadaceae bacterium]|nr:hypothetical protein [Fimbriimonadaceae bacterium]
MKRVAWILVAIGAAVIGALVLGATAFLHKENQTVTALHQAQARAKKLGIPVYASQLHALQIPDEDNAWVDLDKVSKLKASGKFSDSEFAAFPKLLDIQDRQEFVESASKAVAKWEPALELVRSASKKSGYYPKLEWENGAALLRPELATDKGLLKDLLIESRLFFFKGQHDKAIDTLKTATRLVGLMRKDHTELGFMVSVSEENYIADDVIGQAQSTHDAKAISDLRSILDTLYPSIPVRKALEFEPVLFVESVRMSSSDSKAGNELRASIKPEDRPLIPTASSTSPSKALEFEAKAINAACAYYDGLVDDISAYQENDL